MHPSPVATVLVVDDERDVREVVRAFLELDGFDVVAEAVDGAEAVERFLALDPPPTPDVVVLDQRMPVMSGLEAAELMLQQRPDQLVVMFSAHLDDAARAKAKALGVAACLDKTKPARLPHALRELLVA